MSGFFSHLAARGIGQAASVHSAARLPYASPPALADAAEAMAPLPSLQSLPRSAPPQEPAPGPMAARLEAAGEAMASAPTRPPSPMLPRPSIPAPAPKEVSSRDGRNISEAGEETDAGQPFRPPVDAPLRAIPDPVMSAAAHRQEAAPPASDEESMPLRRIHPLLPPQQGPSSTALLKSASMVQGAAWRSPVEETTEVHVSIGRIEVTAVHEAPPPKRAPARGQRALSLEEYLARRKAGRS